MDKGKVNNIIRIPTSLEGDFFKYWLKFLTPFHGLTDKQLEVAAALITERFELSKAIKDEDLLDKIVMSTDTYQKIREKCNLKQTHFYVIMKHLRDAKFIINNKINPKFIPKKLSEGDNCFQLLLYFDLDNNV